MSDFMKLMEYAKAHLHALQRWVETIDWKTIQESIEYFTSGLPKDVESVSIELMNRGWFVWFYDGAMSDFSDKAISLLGKSTQEQDDYMRGYIDLNSDRFMYHLVANHPERSGQIRDAFNSHKSGHYFSSIPAFLVLAEGL